MKGGHRQIRRKRISLAAAVCLAAVAELAPVASAQVVSGRDAGTASLSDQSLTDLERFNEEMELAAGAPDRDSRVEHLFKALSFRPNHPENITIEFRIAIMLSQYHNPKEGQPMRLEEAQEVFEGILERYNHMDYYEREPPTGSSSLQLLVPEAAILASCYGRALNSGLLNAREYLWFALECLNQTCRKRVEDWENTPPPRKENGPLTLKSDKDKWPYQMAFWEKRQRDAAEGDVFGYLEMSTVKIAVTNFGETFGRQKPHEVPAVMGLIIERYPGTPMAKEAQRHIDRAMVLTEEELDEELPELILESFEPSEAIAPEAEEPPEPEVPEEPEVAAGEVAPPEPPPAEGEHSAEDTSGAAWWLGAAVAGLVIIAAALFKWRRGARRGDHRF